MEQLLQRLRQALALTFRVDAAGRCGRQCRTKDVGGFLGCKIANEFRKEIQQVGFCDNHVNGKTDTKVAGQLSQSFACTAAQYAERIGGTGLHQLIG